MKKILNAVLILLVSCQLQAQDISEIGIPANGSRDEFKSLSNCKNPALETRLAKKLKANPEWNKLIKQKKLAVSLVDLSDTCAVRYAEVNGNVMMYAASLPKIAILLAAMDAIEKGELEESDKVALDMKLMISKSDNQASTRMIDRLGYQKISDVLTDRKYNLYDKTQGGGLWVGKRYAAGGKKNPDPMQGLSHAATARQVARFYHMLAFGQLVTKERSEQMLEILVDPALHHKFVNTYERIAPKARLFRKSGSWSVFHSDSIMVWGPERQYILVALVEDANGESIIRKIGSSVDEVITQPLK
jgi:beta-lactamase class A